MQEATPRLTPTGKRMLDVLERGATLDGEGQPVYLRRTVRDLHACLWDNSDDVPLGNIKPHLTILRRWLRRNGRNLFTVYEAGQKMFYVLGRNVGGSSE